MIDDAARERLREQAARMPLWMRDQVAAAAAHLRAAWADLGAVLLDDQDLPPGPRKAIAQHSSGSPPAASAAAATSRPTGPSRWSCPSTRRTSRRPWSSAARPAPKSSAAACAAQQKTSPATDAAPTAPMASGRQRLASACTSSPGAGATPAWAGPTAPPRTGHRATSARPRPRSSGSAGTSRARVGVAARPSTATAGR
jgi:hypothetical protein